MVFIATLNNISVISQQWRWSWLYGSWIYNYLCNQCLSPLTLWVPISIRARCTTLCDKVCQRLATGQWFSLGPLVSSTNKIDCHDKAEILLKQTSILVEENRLPGKNHHPDKLYEWIWFKIVREILHKIGDKQYKIFYSRNEREYKILKFLSLGGKV
jgi:hypothetical protein